MGSQRPRVGVARELLALAPHGGHGKVWHRVLTRLAARTRLVPIDHATGRPLRPWTRRPAVVLADGHGDLPPTRVPLVVEVHEAGWHEPALRDTLDPAFYELISSRTAVAVGTAAHIITLSESSRRDIVAAYAADPQRVHVVHPGLEAPFRPDASGGRATVARACGAPERPYVLFAAALHPRKNLQSLREAMAGLAEEGFPHALVVAGSGATDREDSSELERAAAAALPGGQPPVVRLTGLGDGALAGLMAEADAFCLPSLHEGFGLTALEAMACGAPVVVSDRGALPEVVGDAGVVVPPTPAALRDALRRVLGEPTLAASLGRAGVERARAFSWDTTAAGWLAVLARAAAEGG